MPDLIADYNTAADGFAAVLAKAEQTDLSAASPCPEWTANDVVDHVLGGASFFIQMFGGTDPAPQGTPTERFAVLRAALVDAITAPGAMERMVANPLLGGEVPAAVMFGICASDTLLHTWDLGRAIGEDPVLDPDVLERSWRNVIPMDDALRKPNLFGPKVEVSDDAPMQAQALAFFGRG
jgi:uncharacterized protein (TIGR03086 family)